MTTYSANVTWNANNAANGTNAAYRARIAIIEAALSGCGLVQTSDTGQTSSTTATVPVSPNSDGGYQIWRFNDSRQGTDPLFLKIIYGAGQTNNGHFRFKIQVGQGSNGSGTLTGQLSSEQICGDSPGGNDSVNTVSTQVYACHTDGWFFIMIGPASGLVATGQWALHSGAVMRSKDSSGAFDGTGVCVFAAGSGGSVTTNVASILQSVRWASTAATYASSPQYMIAPGSPADTTVGGNKRLFPAWYTVPDIRPAWAFFGVRGSEVGAAQTTFTATPVGTTSRTFFWAGDSKGVGMDATPNTVFQLAFLWE